MDVVGLAARIAAFTDGELNNLVTRRRVPAQTATLFDLAELLLSPASIAEALESCAAPELRTLATGKTSAELDSLALGAGGEAHEAVQAMAREAASRLDLSWNPSAPSASESAPHTALDETIKIAELVHRIADRPIALRNRGQLPAADVRTLSACIDTDSAGLADRLGTARIAGLTAIRDGRLLASTVADRWCDLSVPEQWGELALAWLRAHPHAEAIAAADVAKAFPLAGDAVGAEISQASRGAEALGLAHRGGLTDLAMLVRDDAPAARALLGSHMPPETASVYLQPDLSIIAPGPLASRVKHRLRTLASVERAGIASQWRLSAESIAVGIARGESAESALNFLGEVSLTPVPQPVAYLVRDTAAKFGRVRVRSVTGVDGARSVARSDDAGLLRTMAVDRSLGAVGVRGADAHRVLFRVSAEEAVDVLVAERYPAVLEDASGNLVVRERERAPELPQEHHPLVARLRHSGFTVAESDRAWLTRQLTAAIRERLPVRLTVELGDEPQDIDLVPLSVAAGRLRARDAVRDVERTLPLSAITRVAGLGVAS